VTAGGYRVRVGIDPNAGGRRDSVFTVRTTRDGRPVTAAVSIRLTMPAMGMPPLGLRLKPAKPGTTAGTGAVLTMPGQWLVRITIRPVGGPPFDVLLVDSVKL
jgi:YtkA-like